MDETPQDLLLVNPYGKLVEVPYATGQELLAKGIGQNGRQFRVANDQEKEYWKQRTEYNSQFSGLSDEDREARAMGNDLRDPFEVHLAQQGKKPLEIKPEVHAPVNSVPQTAAVEPEGDDVAAGQVQPLSPDGVVLAAPSGSAADKLSHSRRRK